jgi:hypothetical protein
MSPTSARCAASRSRGLHATIPWSSRRWTSRRRQLATAETAGDKPQLVLFDTELKGFGVVVGQRNTTFIVDRRIGKKLHRVAEPKEENDVLVAPHRLRDTYTSALAEIKTLPSRPA